MVKRRKVVFFHLQLIGPPTNVLFYDRVIHLYIVKTDLTPYVFLQNSVRYDGGSSRKKREVAEIAE